MEQDAVGVMDSVIPPMLSIVGAGAIDPDEQGEVAARSPLGRKDLTPRS